MSGKPVVFISHKHSDRAIGEVVGSFIKSKTAGNVRVHLSSSPDFEGPRFGRPLNEELKRALVEAELVILIYTTATEDWSYCMWECGLAVDPRDQTPTSIVVVQCGPDEPRLFSGDLRVDAQNLDSIQGFVKALLTTNDHFPRRGDPITGFAAEGSEIKEFAADLHSKLAEVLPSDGPREGKPTSPYLRVRLENQACDRVRTAYLSGDREASHKILETESIIAHSQYAEGLFAAALGPESTLGDVLHNWLEETGNDADPRWFNALTEQMESALAGKMRPLKWAPYKTQKGRADVPFVAASCVVDVGVEFDVYFVPISPRPILVRERMIAIGDTYYKNVADNDPDQLTLSSIVDEMRERSAKRLPILDGERPMTVVHKSTIDEFVAGRAMNHESIEGLTIADLLNHYAGVIDEWYVELEGDATMEEAIDAINAKPMCEDAFVTRDGKLVGWLTNVMLLEE